MRLKVQQMRPKDLNEAIKGAIGLEAFDRAERQRRGIKYVCQKILILREDWILEKW